MSDDAHHPITLPDLVEKWSTLVARVEKGYDHTGYDYVNDLTCRDLLERVLGAAPKPLVDTLLTQILAPLDARYRGRPGNARTPSDSHLCTHANGGGDALR
jgi:hypothetical protein